MMPVIEESELSQGEPPICFMCNEFEAFLFLCGEGSICETCFAKLAEIPEESIFSNEEPVLDFQVSKKLSDKAKSKLAYQRGSNDEQVS